MILLKDYNEYYDGRVNTINTIEECADIASSIYGVSSFGYNEKNNKCYISKTPINKPVLQTQAYHNEYKSTDKICNKTNFILGEKHEKDKNNLIANRLYLCYKDNEDIYEMIYFERNKKQKNITIDDIETLRYEKQKFYYIDFPTEKNEMKDIEIDYNKKVINTEEIKEIKNIKWNKNKEKEKEKDPLDIYEDKSNKRIFKLKENICYNTYNNLENNLENNNLDTYYPKIN